MSFPVFCRKSRLPLRSWGGATFPPTPTRISDVSVPYGVRALVPALRAGSGAPSVEPADKATDFYFDTAGSLLYVMEEVSGTRSWAAVASGSPALRGKTDMANYPAAEQVLRDRLPVVLGDDVFTDVRVEPAVSPIFGNAKYEVVGDTGEYTGVTVAELDAGGRYLGGPGAAFGGTVPAVGTQVACGGSTGVSDGDALALLSDIPTTSETLQGEDMEANPTQRQLSEAVKKIWKALGGTVICLMMCLTLFAEVTGETEWQDVPPETPMGTVVSDLSLCTVAAARAMTNAIVHPVTSVNSKTGDVNLTAAEVGALEKEWQDESYGPSVVLLKRTMSNVTSPLFKVTETPGPGSTTIYSWYAEGFTVPWSRVTGAPAIPTDSTVSGWGYIKSWTETDPTVPAWAKATSKPTYTASDVHARPDDWMPTAAEVGARPNDWMPNAQEVGARPNVWMPNAQEVGARPDDWMPTAWDVGAVAVGANGGVAIGVGTTASGNFSHAEGYDTTASGNFSHAEGNYTSASGDYSHAEGSYTSASGDYSHDEGIKRNANEKFSFSWNGDGFYHIQLSRIETFNLNHLAGFRVLDWRIESCDDSRG